MTTADQKSTHIIALFGQSIFMNSLWYYTTTYVPLISPKHFNLNNIFQRTCDNTLSQLKVSRLLRSFTLFKDKASPIHYLQTIKQCFLDRSLGWNFILNYFLAKVYL